MIKIEAFKSELNGYVKWTRTIAVFEDRVEVETWGGDKPERDYPSLYHDHIDKAVQNGAQLVFTTDKDVLVVRGKNNNFEIIELVDEPVESTTDTTNN